MILAANSRASILSVMGALFSLVSFFSLTFSASSLFFFLLFSGENFRSVSLYIPSSFRWRCPFGGDFSNPSECSHADDVIDTQSQLCVCALSL